METVRRAKWHPPPPQTPRILNIPRRIRRKPTKQLAGKPSSKGKLESLFDQERVFSRTVPIVLLSSVDDRDERRERVDREDEEEDSEEQKWRFQAEILRAECNFLRMERDIALKKLELNRVQTKRTLRSAVETLVSGKEKLLHKGKIEEIENLEEKLKELQRNSSGVRDFEFGKCRNFDKQASVLQKRLAKLGEEEKCVKEIREMAEASLTIKETNRKSDENISFDQEDRFKDVEVLRRKMERLSKGMLERMEEEYGSMLSSCASSVSGNYSATSSASTSRRIEFPILSSSTSHVHLKETKSNEDKTCSGRCKKIVRKIVEQVRAEMEQWSQMQEMLERVREEMEELQSSRDFWQDRALDSDDQIQSFHSTVQEWKNKARCSETKVTELEKQINELHLELSRLKHKTKKDSSRVIRDMQKEKEKEKRVLICRLKENHQTGGNGSKNKEWDNQKWQKEEGGGSNIVLPKRSPLGDMGNSSSPLLWENRMISVPCAMP